VAGTATPLINGTAAVGTSTKWAHEDHVHPTDTTRAPLASPTFTGAPKAPTPTAGDNSTNIATTAFVAANAAVSGVSSIAGNTGAFTLTNGLTNTGNAIGLSVPVTVARGGTGDTGTAWTTYTPTITAGSGTFGSVTGAGRYKVMGKTVYFNLLVTVTTVGTAAQNIVATLPAGMTSAAIVSLSGVEVNATGNMVRGFINSGASTISMAYYNNTFPGGSGNAVCISGVFEIA
jgi:hypothetical protein